MERQDCCSKTLARFSEIPTQFRAIAFFAKDWGVPWGLHRRANPVICSCMSFKRRIRMTVWVFLLAFAVRMIVLSRTIDSPIFLAMSGDMRFYCDWALRIAAGHWTDGKAFYGLPGYPFFLGAIFRLTGFNPFVVELLQALSEAGIAALIFEIGCAVVPERKGTVAAALAALGWIFFQPAQAFSAVLMPTTWLVLAFWGIVWWSMRTHSESLWRPWLWMGLLTGFVAMTVATILFVVPLPIFAAARNLRKPGAVLIAAAVLIAGVFVGTAPCWLHNYLIAREPVFLSAHSGVNFWVGNNPVATGYPKMPPGLRASQEGMLKDSIRVAETAAGHRLTRAQVSKFWSDKASNFIHREPKKWRKLMLRKLRNLWNAFQYDDLSLITMLSEDGILTPGLRFGVVAALAIPGLVFALGRRPYSRWVVAAVLLHMAALLPVFVTERYRLAAAPGLLLLAAVGLVDLWATLAWRNPGWWRWAAAYCGAGIAGVWFVSMPQRDESLWSLDCYNTGIKAMDAGELDRAMDKLERAYAFVPDNSENSFSLGNLWLKKGNRNRARQFYIQAIQINPATMGALNNLAVLEVQEKNWKFASALLKSALRIEPDDAKMHYLLAYTSFGAGDVSTAKVEIAQALELRPAQKEFQQFQEDLHADRTPQPFSITP